MDDSVRYRINHPREDRIQYGVAFTHRKAIIHIYAGIDRGQAKLFTLFGNIVITVVADDDAVRFPFCHRLQAGGRICKIGAVPGRIMIRQEHIIVCIPFIYRYDYLFLTEEFLLFGRPHHRVHL